MNYLLPIIIGTPVYKKIYFSPEQWRILIRKSGIKTNIWIDMFDRYSFEILSQNFDYIYGIKLQPSILNNLNLFELLKNLNLKSKIIILNISGVLFNDIKNILKKFEELKPKKIIIQFGFQSYPTKISDTNLNKINFLKKLFFQIMKYVWQIMLMQKIHFSLSIPIYSYLLGAGHLEKHFCIKRKNHLLIGFHQ